MPAITAALLSSYVAYKFSNLQIALAVFIAGFGAALLVSWIRSGMIAGDPETMLVLGMERFDLVPMRYRIERRLVGWLVPPAVGYATFQLLTNMLVPVEPFIAPSPLVPDLSVTGAAECTNNLDRTDCSAFIAPKRSPPTPLATAPALQSGRMSDANLRKYCPTCKNIAEFMGRERRCLAMAIYWESRDEPLRRQIAVAQVIINRVRSPLFPRTICGVVYQDHMSPSCQFRFACDGRSDMPQNGDQWTLAQSVAKKEMAGELWLPELGHTTSIKDALGLTGPLASTMPPQTLPPASEWPPAGIDAVRTICYQQPRSDVPPASLDAYCTCYVALVQQNISWHDWFLVDVAIRTKGLQNLDAQEKSIMIRALDDGVYCLEKTVQR